MGIEVKIVADSISPDNIRLITMQVKFHRFVLPEWNTHRMFSRNAASSRAIPVTKMIEEVKNDPAIPIHIGKNIAGMQAKEELTGVDREAAIANWLAARDQAVMYAEHMNKLGVHKQVVNRLLEPFMWTSVVVTGTGEAYANFFNLRYHPDAQPEIQALAMLMYETVETSEPKKLEPGQWHLPYIGEEDIELISMRFEHQEFWENLRRISAARCCRVSYNKHDGTKATLEEDLALCDRLIGSVPLHASPFEHQATPDKMTSHHEPYNPEEWVEPELHGNLTGWKQYRKMLPNEFVTTFKKD